MTVLDPLKVVITTYPEAQTEEFELPNHPNKPEMGTRTVPFAREIYIERDDFMEIPPNKKYKRLAPGVEVRLRGAYLATCTDVIKDSDGNITELRCTHDPDSKGGSAPDGRKVKGTIHWVSAQHGVEAEVRLYDRLFTSENPAAEEGDFKEYLNPDSLKIITGIIEPGLANAKAGEKFQFERIGYFCADLDTSESKPVFNRTVGLREAASKQA